MNIFLSEQLKKLRNERIFGKVFWGGSKRIGRLPDKVVCAMKN